MTNRRPDRLKTFACLALIFIPLLFLAGCASGPKAADALALAQANAMADTLASLNPGGTTQTYLVQTPANSNGWSQSMANATVSDRSAGGGVNVNLNALMHELLGTKPTSTMVNDDGSTTEIYVRPDGATLTVIALKNGVTAWFARKSEGVTASLAGTRAP